MATTTNYSWTTPDDTDLVKDGAAAIRTLGSSADTTVKNLNPGTTAGDIDYYTSSTAKARIAIGTAGQVLQVNSGATAPEWATPAAGGKVLQVVSATYSTSTTIASTNFTDTGLSATITPSATNSKVLVLVQQASYSDRLTNQTALGLQLVRAATNIVTTTGELLYVAITGGTDASLGAYQTLTWLDDPNTTSATTYKMQMRAFSTANSGKAIAQTGSTPSSIVLLEIGA